MSSPDRVRVSTVVAVDAPRAFALFTERIDSWWRRGPRFRPGIADGGRLRLEPRVGGRLVEEYEQADAFVLGRVRCWEPPERLVFSFAGRQFEPDEQTEVEVRFEPLADGTRVTVEHRGWRALRPDHPARHGLDGSAWTALQGLWWSDLLLRLRTLAEPED